MVKVAISLIVLALLVPSHEQDAPLSPCPSIFEYQQPESEQGRWDGILHLSTDEPLYSVFLNIVLDNKAELLGNWIGEVSTQDNKEFRIETTEVVIIPGSPIDVKFYVKFNTVNNKPLMQRIKLNGKEICNADIPLSITERPTTAPPATTPPVITEAPLLSSTSTNSPSLSLIPENSLTTNKVNNLNRSNLENSVPDIRPNPVFLSRIDDETTKLNENGLDISTPSPTKQNQCGTVSLTTPFIREGAPTQEEIWPWQVAIYHTEFADLKFTCGGTLVSHLHIITAAHCVTLRGSIQIRNVATFNVLLGKHNLKTSGKGVKFRLLNEIMVHNEYEPSSFLRDIAILEMQRPVTYSAWIQPACLWPEDMIAIRSVVGKNGTVAGWDFNGKGQKALALRKVDMLLVDPFVCLQSLPMLKEKITLDHVFCAGYSNGSSACIGDGGGGMLFKLNDLWYLRGLVSLGVYSRDQEACDPTQYIVFTDVAKFLPWIKGIITDL